MLWMSIWMCPHHVTAAHADQACRICDKSGQVSADMWWWNEVIDAIDPTHIHLTSILYIYKVFDNHYMLWICIWMCPHHILPLMPTKLLEFCQKSGLLPGNNSWWNEVIEAVDPTHIHLTSILYIYKVFDNHYMLWMCIWMCPHHVTAARTHQAFGISLEIWATPSQWLMWNAVIAAVDPTYIHLASMSHI